MTLINHLLVKNRSWATQQKARDPNFFPQLAQEQKPHTLWIGCIYDMHTGFLNVLEQRNSAGRVT